jgi:hypothetical protein
MQDDRWSYRFAGVTFGKPGKVDIGEEWYGNILRGVIINTHA